VIKITIPHFNNWLIVAELLTSCKKVPLSPVMKFRLDRGDALNIGEVNSGISSFEI